MTDNFLTNRRRFVGALGAAALAPLATAGRALAATYPDKPITFICPWPAGGTADATMRMLCAVASRALDQQIVFTNRPGAAGMIGLQALASAKPDGYTIGQISISVTRFYQLGTVPVNPLSDLTYIARTSGQTFGIAVLAGSPWKTLKEFVAHARANPGKVTYSHSGIGGATHVGMEEFALAAGIELNNIAYKGGADALIALMGGHVDAIADSSSWAPGVQSGKLRLLATWGEQRTSEFKDAPTLKDLGYNVVVDAPNGVGAPKGLEPAVAAKLRAAFKTATESTDFASACKRYDATLMYLDGPAYEKYVAEVYQKEKVLIEKINLRELIKKG